MGAAATGAETPPSPRNAIGDEDIPPTRNPGMQIAGQAILSGFSGFSMAERRAFALKYNEYVRKCNQA
jgi:hypothetical protein